MTTATRSMATRINVEKTTRRVIVVDVTGEKSPTSLYLNKRQRQRWPRGPNVVKKRNGRSPAAIAIRCSGVVGWQRVVGTPTQIGRTTACGGVHIKIGHPSLPSFIPVTLPSYPTIDHPVILFIAGVYALLARKCKILFLIHVTNVTAGTQTTQLRV